MTNSEATKIDPPPYPSYSQKSEFIHRSKTAFYTNQQAKTIIFYTKFYKSLAQNKDHLSDVAYNRLNLGKIRPVFHFVKIKLPRSNKELSIGVIKSQGIEPESQRLASVGKIIENIWCIWHISGKLNIYLIQSVPYCQ